MTALLNFSLTNAVLVVILGLLVLAITRLWQNPYAARFLWLLVLIKFVTPPLFEIPFPDPGFTKSRSDVTDSSRGRSISLPLFPNLSQTPQDNVNLIIPENDATHTANNSTVSTRHSSVDGRATLPIIVVSVWLTGSLLWFLVSIYRIARFDRIIRSSSFVDESLQHQINSLAQRMGLSRAPQGRLTKASIAPLIWFTRLQPILLFPSELLKDLTKQQTDTVLAHELSHLKQHDHLVRWFELIIIVLFWWHPVLWWTVRQLHNAEEECSDASVLHLFPGKQQLYGETLLKAAEFLNRQPFPPATAISLGQSHQLKRRLTMILKNRPPLRISLLKRIALLMFAVVVLPLSARAFPDGDAVSKLEGSVTQLRWKLKTGETLRYTLKAEYKYSTSLIYEPNPKIPALTNDIDGTTSQQFDMEWKVIEIKPDGMISISMRIPQFRMSVKNPNQNFEFDSKDNRTGDEALRKISQAITESEFQFLMDSSGKIKTVTVPEKLLDALKEVREQPFASYLAVLNAENLEYMLNPVLLSLPETTVTKGDVWNREEEWYLGDHLIVSDIQYSYSGPSKENLQRIDLETTTKVQRVDDMGGAEKIVFKKGENKGNVLFDSKSGRIRESRYLQTFSMMIRGPQFEFANKPQTKEMAEKMKKARLLQTLTSKTTLLLIPESR